MSLEDTMKRQAGLAIGRALVQVQRMTGCEIDLTPQGVDALDVSVSGARHESPRPRRNVSLARSARAPEVPIFKLAIQRANDAR